MKLQVTQENFKRALNNVARVASTRNSLPILSNILIKTIDNRVAIAATNLNIAITHYIGSKVEKPGAITVPARLMQDFISSLSPGVIDILVDDTKLHIKTNSINSTVNGTAVDDYPVMPKIKNGISWSVPTNQLKKTLQQTIIAASNDNARPVLTAVYFHTYKGQLYVVSTDSYRLVECRVMPLQQEVSLLIPATAIIDLLRVIDDSTQEINITHDDQQVLFKVGDIELTTRLVDGAYPDYRRLIPSSFQTTATLSRAELANITKVSSLFARESAGSVTLEVDEEKKQVSIQSIASQLGENTATSSAEVEGAGSITLNSRFILDALAVIDDEQVSVSFSGKIEPCAIRGDNKDYLHIIMPLKS